MKLHGHRKMSQPRLELSLGCAAVIVSHVKDQHPSASNLGKVDHAPSWTFLCCCNESSGDFAQMQNALLQAYPLQSSTTVVAVAAAGAQGQFQT